ncbi:hypothetical protein SLOPH_1770 [Spraguea lophii 42_110]|uniref:Uncharacterized protein n=1 Tax=Spraguea lophii (strain 42_110) TaxID=1358809 RepID=S7W8G7_SPRLO|nr:hypothetical protein SLOPH_1770 [Spraguea lophii 42_110]
MKNAGMNENNVINNTKDNIQHTNINDYTNKEIIILNIESLKEKIFSFGVFGDYLNKLASEELLLALDQDWIEIITSDEAKQLRENFTSITLKSYANEIKEELITLLNQNGCTIEYDKNILQNNIKDIDNLNIINKSYLDGVLSKYIVKMNTLQWKEYLTNGHFNFTSKEYYYVLDALIKYNGYILNRKKNKNNNIENEYITISEIRTALNIDSKKMFYIINKLCDLKYIVRSKDNKYFIKINTDKNGKMYKGMKTKRKISMDGSGNGNPYENIDDGDIKEIGNNKNIDKNKYIVNNSKEYLEKISKIQLMWKTPLIHQVKNILINSTTGVSSKDIEEKLGIKIKLALKLLQKVAKEEEDIEIVEEFEGKIKRSKFYYTKRNKKESSDNTAPEGISLQDRINAIEQMLLARPYFLINKETLLEFQYLLNSKYTPDRKTILNAAKKGNFKVIEVENFKEALYYKQCEEKAIDGTEIYTENDVKPIKCDCRIFPSEPKDETNTNNGQKTKFAVCRRDIDSFALDSYQEFLNAGKLSDFQKNIYRLFVTYPRYIELDNKYIPDKEERDKIFYNYLLSFNRKVNRNKEDKLKNIRSNNHNDLQIFNKDNIFSFSEERNNNKYGIDTQKKYIFDCECIYNMSLNVFFSVVPCFRMNSLREVIKIIIEYFKKFTNKYSECYKQVYKEFIINRNREYVPGKLISADINNVSDSSEELDSHLISEKDENENKKECVLYKYKLIDIINIDRAVIKYINSKVSIKYFKEYFSSQYFKEVEIEEGKIIYKFNEIKGVQTTKEKINLDYIDYDKRVLFFNKVKNISQEYFYAEAAKIIENEFNEYKETLTKRLAYIKRVMDKDNTAKIIEKKNSIEKFNSIDSNIFINNGYLYNRTFKDKYYIIKKYIIENHKLKISKLDLSIFNKDECIDDKDKDKHLLTEPEIQKILNMLSNKKVISNFKKNSRAYNKITLNDNFIRRIKNNVFHSKDSIQSFYNSIEDFRKEYLQFYYNKIYYILLRSGTQSFNNILGKIDYMEDFELEDFIEIFKNTYFTNIFKLRNINGERFISLNISELDEII